MQKVFYRIQTSLSYRIIMCFIIGMFFLTNCARFTPCRLDSKFTPVKDRPEQEFLIGHYITDAATLEMIKGYEGGYLNINPDGSIEIRNIPISVFDIKSYAAGQTKGVDFTGTWKSGIHKESAHLFADISFDKKPTILNDKGYLVTWQILSKDGKAVIIIPLGDPDECRAVRFIKE
ncbi:hypothetical protein ED312_14590 [Sinomicrobium pectinilyticum]|uniref:Uncharacterized protein n=1 Tax=Sinomicrobium pectinilyticum TaxID=1084421 RepID=A0A3N0E7G1_SINP1|nr:hypothetical protein [Sinomicrobium pectinilyticum]RNL83709.1 hypothetical protein ED312_14590 [Sinomicrobium pectinilyticum]